MTSNRRTNTATPEATWMPTIAPRQGTERKRRSAPSRGDRVVRNSRNLRLERQPCIEDCTRRLETGSCSKPTCRVPPFTVLTTANTTNAFPAGPLRPNLLRDPSLPSSRADVARWFDTTAFASSAPFTFGNSPRSVLRGAPSDTTDSRWRKSFGFTERVKFDVRGEFYNLLNHANFNIPGFTLGAGDFGVVTTARPGRTVQLAARLSF